MDAAVREKVCHIRDKVADRIGANRYRTWFGETTEFILNDGHLDITVANAFVGRWIASNYLKEITQATRDVLGSEPRVEIRVAERTTPVRQTPPPQTRKPAHRPARRRPDRSRLRGDLATFVVGASNSLAYAAAASVVRSPTEAFKPLVVHGGCGLGKTHLLHGICNGCSRQHSALEWRYISGEEFTNEFVYAVKAGRIDAFRARFRKVDLLVIDDIHFLAGKKATQEEFLHTFNAIDGCGRTVVLSSDRHPRDIAMLSEPLIDRLIAGVVVETKPPELATRREILLRRAATMHTQLPEDVLEYVARNVMRNVRELEGALFKLVALASLTKEAVTLDLARTALADYTTRRNRSPEAADIERIVANRFGVSVELLHSRARDRTVSLARAVAMFLIRKHTRMSYPEIGRAMGNKNHSTVVMATRRIEKTLQERGAVQWKALSGNQEAPLSELLGSIERDLAARCD